MYKAITVGYVKNYTRDTYKLQKPETNRIMIIRDINWAEWKNTDPEETMNMFHNLNEKDLVPGIDRR